MDWSGDRNPVDGVSSGFDNHDAENREESRYTCYINNINNKTNNYNYKNRVYKSVYCKGLVLGLGLLVGCNETNGNDVSITRSLTRCHQRRTVAALSLILPSR